MMFRDQVGVLTDWFKSWNECEQTVALLSLLKRVSRTQARFLQIFLEHLLADCTEIHILEAEANNAAIVSQWHHEPTEKVVSLLLSHLPLLQPRNSEAKCEYMKLLQKVLSHTIESSLFVEESRQLLSYALIHPATSLEDRTSLAMWLNHLEEHLSTGYMPMRPPVGPYHSRQGSDEWVCSEASDPGHAWQGKPTSSSSSGSQNGHLSFHGPSGVPSPINSVCTGTNTVLSKQIHPSPLKRSMSLVPSSPQACSTEWHGQEEGGGRPGIGTTDHAPLSPQSSVASSGSEQTEDQVATRNTFQEEGSGMKDVPAWLKSLRLHKYAALFSQMTYEEMMILTEQHLESQNVTKGARHKIALSIQKLRERQCVLKSLEKDILDGGNLRSALQELQQIIITPIKAYSLPVTAQKEADPKATSSEKGSKSSEDKDAAAEGFQSNNPPACDGESTVAPISDGDIAGQFTRVMGKVCTQLLVSRPDEENISCYLQLIEKCLMHEAFTDTQKKRLSSWKQQVLKLLRLFPRKSMLDIPVYRQKGWAYGSNSLPTAGSVGGGLGRRGQKQFPMPPRGVTPGRLGLLNPGSIGTASPRHTLTSPALAGQGRQNLWFSNPSGSNSMPSQSRSSVQRTYSLPVHTSPQTMLLYQQSECQVAGTDLEINPTLESLCLSMTEHALGDGMDRTSTI
ncbi:protein Smaug homolog 2 [Paramormyrops kingsleyae]|uniref:Sterile alpha motif domain containing 4B n=1 Tax=Paramormyrops kingsleyae TaxID=1676925 RepID=A0A3B3QGX5_9TELE|nr:protein Smaug homolog 2 [Paramormyrops kingsleyae]